MPLELIEWKCPVRTAIFMTSMASLQSEDSMTEIKATRYITDLYDDHKNLLFSLALSILGNRQDAEDVIQIVFQKIWKEKNGPGLGSYSYS